MGSIDEQHALLLESLERRARAFEAAHARRYSNNDLAADAPWAEEMARYRTLRLARACVRCVCVCVCACACVRAHCVCMCIRVFCGPSLR